MAADLPKGRSRGTRHTLSAALALGAKAPDPRLALRAGMALAEHLPQAPVSNWGFPVRKPEPALLRRVQPRLSEEDAEVLASASGSSRGLPPEVAPQLFGLLSSKVMGPILDGKATVDEAARGAAAALDDLLTG